MSKFLLLYIFIIAIISGNALAGTRRVWLHSAEAMPVFWSGGLGYAVTEQAKLLTSLGYDVTIFMPYSSAIDSKYANDSKYKSQLGKIDYDLSRIEVYVGNNEKKTFRVNRAFNQGFEIKMLEHLPDGEIDLYSSKNFFNNFVGSTGKPIYTHFPEEVRAFGVENKAFVQYLINTNLDLQPDVVIVSDWSSGIIPLMIKSMVDSAFAPAVVNAVHNLKYQGKTNLQLFEYLHGNARYLEAYNQNGEFNTLKGAMELSDVNMTVALNYLKEISQAAAGENLDHVIRRLIVERRFTAILNAATLSEWDPSNPPEKFNNILPYQYSADDPSNKLIGKEKLLLPFLGFTATDELPAEVPILYNIARIDGQKGYDNYMLDRFNDRGEIIFKGAFRRLLENQKIKLRFVVVGDPVGSPEVNPLIKSLRQLQTDFPNQFRYLPYSGTYKHPTANVDMDATIVERFLTTYGDQLATFPIFEPSGTTQFKAWPSLNPVLSTSVGGLKESVDHGKNGYLIDIAYRADGSIDNDATAKRIYEGVKHHIGQWNGDENYRKMMMKNSAMSKHDWIDRGADYDGLINYAINLKKMSRMDPIPPWKLNAMLKALGTNECSLRIQ